MFFFSKSYEPGWRVFYPTDQKGEVHAELKKHCVWGGYDKTEVLEGIEYLGYEFCSLEEALHVVKTLTPVLNQPL